MTYGVALLTAPPFEYGLMTLKERAYSAAPRVERSCGDGIISDKQNFETFVPLAEWERLYQQWRNKKYLSE